MDFSHLKGFSVPGIEKAFSELNSNNITEEQIMKAHENGLIEVYSENDLKHFMSDLQKGLEDDVITPIEFEKAKRDLSKLVQKTVTVNKDGKTFQRKMWVRVAKNEGSDVAKHAGISEEEFNKLHPGTKKELENNMKKDSDSKNEEPSSNKEKDEKDANNYRQTKEYKDSKDERQKDLDSYNDKKRKQDEEDKVGDDPEKLAQFHREKMEYHNKRGEGHLYNYHMGKRDMYKELAKKKNENKDSDSKDKES